MDTRISGLLDGPWRPARPDRARWWLIANVLALPILFGAWWFVSSYPRQDDVYAFWNAWSDGHLYPARWEPVSEYVYSPAFAQGFWPLTHLRFPLVNGLWAAAQLVGLAWMLGPVGAVVALAFPIPFLADYGHLPYAGPVYASLYNGNPMILTAAAITAGVRRWPGVFAFVLLTKVSAGVGIAFFAVRRESRRLAWALGTTAAIALVSFVAAPALWAEWFALLGGAVGHAGSADALAKEEFVPIPLAVRGTAGLLLVTLAGLRGWAWAVPIGCFLALPDIHFGGFAVLAAVPAVWLRGTVQPARPPAISMDGAPG